MDVPIDDRLDNILTRHRRKPVKKNFVRSSLLVFGVISILSFDSFAQEITSPSKNQIQEIKSENNVLQNYAKTSSLSVNERAKFFSNLSAEDKTSLFKLQMALQFIKRSDLTKEQKDVLLDGISLTSPEIYEKSTTEQRAKAEQVAKTLQQKSLAVFPPNEAYEIFASISGGNDDVRLLQKYQESISFPTMLERRRFFREASPTNRSDIWKVQMAYYLATDKLNRQQQDFILEVISLSTPEGFVFPSSKDEAKNTSRKTLDDLREKALDLFSREEIFKIFMSLGRAEEKPSLKDGSTQNVRPECGCTWWCSPCHRCDTGGCDSTTSGCGWTLGDPWTGRCVFDVNTCPK